MTWFRLDDDVVNDPKVQRLPDALFKAWINLLCLASKGGGTLPAAADIAFTLRTTTPKVEKVLTALIEARLLDRHGDALRPHNWDARQFKSDVTDPTAASRQRRYRNRKRDGPVTQTVTDHVTEGVTVTDTTAHTQQIQNRTEEDAASRPPAAASPDQETDLFRRGKQVLGDNAGGMIAKLKKHQGSVAKARAVIETASTKQDAREYVGRVLSGQQDDGFFGNSGAIV